MGERGQPAVWKGAPELAFVQGSAEGAQPRRRGRAGRAAGALRAREVPLGLGAEEDPDPVSEWPKGPKLEMMTGRTRGRGWQVKGKREEGSSCVSHLWAFPSELAAPHRPQHQDCGLSALGGSQAQAFSCPCG